MRQRIPRDVCVNEVDWRSECVSCVGSVLIWSARPPFLSPDVVPAATSELRMRELLVLSRLARRIELKCNRCENRRVQHSSKVYTNVNFKSLSRRLVYITLRSTHVQPCPKHVLIVRGPAPGALEILQPRQTGPVRLRLWAYIYRSCSLYLRKL